MGESTGADSGGALILFAVCDIKAASEFFSGVWLGDRLAVF